MLNIIATARIGLPAAVIVFYMFAAGDLPTHFTELRKPCSIDCLATLVPGVRFISLLVLEWRAFTFLRAKAVKQDCWAMT